MTESPEMVHAETTMESRVESKDAFSSMGSFPEVKDSETSTENLAPTEIETPEEREAAAGLTFQGVLQRIPPQHRQGLHVQQPLQLQPFPSFPAPVCESSPFDGIGMTGFSPEEALSSTREDGGDGGD